MSTRASRLDIRITKRTKEMIERAASFLGVTTSAFILECAAERAAKVLEQAQQIELNETEGQRFIALLDNPPPSRMQNSSVCLSCMKLRKSVTTHPLNA